MALFAMKGNKQWQSTEAL